MFVIAVVLILWMAALLFIVATAYGYYKARSCYDVDVFTNKQEGWDKGWKAGFDSGVEAEKGKGYSQGYDEGWKKGFDKGQGQWQETWHRGYQAGGEAIVEVLDTMHMLRTDKDELLKTLREAGEMWETRVPTPQVETTAKGDEVA